MGTSDPLIDSALQEAGWLRRLARSLVKDAGRAEDALQETWVAALEHAEEPRSSPRGWLSITLRNKLRQEARARGRRAAHEQRVELARSEPSAHDVSERLEVQALLLEAVRGLEEPYRATIVARFFDGLPPRAIARRDGVPVRTVNTRLERGLAQLRARLDGRFGGERSAWLAALLPFAGSEWSGPWRLGEGLAVGATLKVTLVVVVVAGAIWFGRALFVTGDESSKSAAAAGATSSPDERATARVAGSLDDAGAEISSVSVDAGRAAIVTPDASTTCRIRVVSANSHAPVPGARVWLQREDVDYDSPAWKLAMRRFNDVEPVLQSGLGIELVLDERGEVLVPRPARELTLAAVLGELHGEGDLAPQAAECVIEVKPYRSLAVEVVDRSGRPVPGAYVALYSGEFDPFASFWTWPTDADGRAWIPKLEEQVGERERIVLALTGGVPSEPELVRFTLESAPREPVRFVVGDFGRIVVQLSDARGEALSANGTANIGVVWERLLEPSGSQRKNTEVFVPVFDGRAAAVCVGLDLPLAIMGAADGYDSVWREVPGPTEPGQELRVLVPVQSRKPVARGRVHGIPALLGAAPEGEVTLCGTVHGLGSFYARVREGTSFEAWLPTSYERANLAVPWFITLSCVDRPAVHTRAVPTLIEGGIDFGDVVFAPVQELARVRVVDETGATAASAGVETRSTLGVSTWQADASGACILVGSLAELPIEARAYRNGFLKSAWTTLATPGAESTLVLRGSATLETSLLLPERVRLEELEIELSSEAGPDDPKPMREEGLEGGQVRILNCEPGHATLSVTDWEHKLLFERTGIELVAGQTTVLDPIDLRDLLHSFTLSFEHASGEPWRRGHVELRQPDGSLTTSTNIDSSGRATFLTLQTSVDLWAVGRGTRARLFEGVHDGDRFVLPASPAIVLQLARIIPLPAPPLELMLRADRVRPAEVEFETYDDVDIEDPVVHDDGSVRLEQSWPGDYALTWFVRHTGTGVDFPVTQAERQTVSIPDTAVAPLVEARLKAEELARAVLDAGG
ncbi:MAG: sigma-70 family RNA polymerase sigma factor [Planctomycetes bacterium]|nr:sigma-70 family RNA polymerase sigma factor [Planctomycetota bacterium]